MFHAIYQQERNSRCGRLDAKYCELNTTDDEILQLESLILPRVYWLKGPILLTWFNINLSMDKWSRHSNGWDEIANPFPNFNGCTIEV